jgi:hypothetical protein
MADGKDTRSFFRKVVNFVVNPATEWGESGKPEEAARDSDFAKSELKAMIERKRRNDFVRKRELDMLRRLRRQGLTPEQLAALGSSSGMADTEGRADAEAPAGSGMKAKIDEIEQQMAGHAIPTASRRPAAPPGAPGVPRAGRDAPVVRTVPAALMDDAAQARSVADTVIQDAPGLQAASSAPAVRGGGAVVMPPAAAGPVPVPMDSRSPQAMEVTEAAHDPDLDEIAISYANGDNETAERLLLALVRHGGARGHHAETWMVLFDLYRATGQQEKFETMAIEFADRFGRSAPHWFSVPRLIAEAAAAAVAPRPRAARIDGRVGWVCPEQLDADAVAQLRNKSLAMPLPWVFDWRALKGIDAAAAEALLALLRHWGPQTIDMRWLGGDRLADLLAEAAPIGVRDADPVYWQLRLQMLRMCNRPDRFDEVAIDYCVTYEMSPPSWESTLCRVRISGQSGGDLSAIAPTTMVGEASTSFVESQLTEEPGLVQLVRLELSGPLVGDISEVLGKLDQQLGSAKLVEIACTRLLRVDFMASGDLLNWVLTRRRDDRTIAFVETNRLVALFFRAIGIDEQAAVKVRAV